MTKKELPQCSIEGCCEAAGVIFDGELLCGQHANEAFEQRQTHSQAPASDEAN